ncbi:ROK family protein [Mesorhizobium sp. LHD-90]|uniref:ROK family protein n=1 Tax=Mesorhizobium sp. LHD-90 TaxID=3071414 RepID=UPI0027DF4C75|nr:ROK family protein [Mesorhizobium sp. LHD-90]MDQ6435280.1 ROK family protein [Mesorhizobium sp. LHD-90]
MATAIGVDVGGTRVRVARVDAAGQVLVRLEQPTAGAPDLVCAQIEDLVHALDDATVEAVGIGVPGRVDISRNRMMSGGYVDLSSIDLGSILAKTFGRPVVLDNDGNMALYAEHAIGAARSAGTAVMFTIGTGIGGAVLADGRILRGRAAAGQLGHLTVDSNGARCLCGRRGCVETTSSGTALAGHLAAAGLPAATSVDKLLEESRNASAAAGSVLAAWAGPMRFAIDTAIAAFDPEMVVLGGGLGAAMHEALAQIPDEAVWYRCPVVPAALGDRAGVIGAGLAALSRQG